MIEYRQEHLAMEKQIQRSQKLETIGVLTGGIAHDFNNVLTPIMAYSELARYHLEPGSHIHKDLTEIDKAAFKGKKLVSQLMTFSRKSEDEKQIIKLKPVIQDVIELIRPSIDSNIEINFNYENNCGPIHADTIKIHQTLINLCTNAFHAMEGENGSIELYLRKVELSEKETENFPGLKSGSYNLITISDTGKGIEKENLEKIFEPFYTTKEAGKGTGLGLSVAKRIINNHSGEIFVSSVINKGTTFSIYLPVIDSENEELTDTEDEHFFKGNGERILVIDDDKSVTKALIRTLTFMGYDVTEAQDSEEAIRIISKEEKIFSMIVSDYMMPYLNGIEFTRKFRESDNKTPIIILTGNEEKIRDSDVNDLKISEVIRKPVSIVNLSEALYKVFNSNSK